MCLIGILVLGVGCTEDVLGGSFVGTKSPNVVLISVDTLRADAVGTYGGRVPTPVMDALADRGTVFERAYAPAGLTAPSHATLLTGREPLEHGIIRNGTTLPPGTQLIAEQFRAAGYASAAFVSSFVLDARFGWDRGFDHFDAKFPEDGATVPKELGAPGVFFNKHSFAGFDRRADATVDAALAWLADAPEPYFLFVHLFDPHDPYVPPLSYSLALADQAFDVVGRSAPGARKPERLERIVRRYHAEVMFTDAELGRLLEAVAAKSERRTLTALTADHGEGLGQHDWLAHARNLYDEVLHVPLIVADTAHPSARRLRTPVGIVDVAPTLLELAGGVALEQATGLSLAQSIREGIEPQARPLYAHRRPHLASPIEFRGERVAVRDGNWKWILNDLIDDEFYDLASDPGELRDRLPRQNAGSTEAERAVALETLAEAHRSGNPSDAAPPEISAEVRAALDALGYTD